jgi:hypothetical protein
MTICQLIDGQYILQRIGIIFSNTPGVVFYSRAHSFREGVDL